MISERFQATEFGVVADIFPPVEECGLLGNRNAADDFHAAKLHLYLTEWPTPGFGSARMNAGRELRLPPGTAVYCCPRGMIFVLKWHAAEGTHILRTAVARRLCEVRHREQLRAIVREFRRLAVEQGFDA